MMEYQLKYIKKYRYIRKAFSMGMKLFIWVAVCNAICVMSTMAQQKATTGSNSSLSITTFWDSVGGGKPVSLYNGKVPNRKQGPASNKETNDKAWSRKVTEPEMIPFIPDAGKRTGTAIVIFPVGMVSDSIIKKPLPAGLILHLNG